MNIKTAKLKIALHTFAQKELNLLDGPIDRCDWREIAEEFEQLYTKRECPDCGPSIVQGIHD